MQCYAGDLYFFLRLATNDSPRCTTVTKTTKTPLLPTLNPVADSKIKPGGAQETEAPPQEKGSQRPKISYRAEFEPSGQTASAAVALTLPHSHTSRTNNLASIGEEPKKTVKTMGIRGLRSRTPRVAMAKSACGNSDQEARRKRGGSNTINWRKQEREGHKQRLRLLHKSWKCSAQGRTPFLSFVRLKIAVHCVRQATPCKSRLRVYKFKQQKSCHPLTAKPNSPGSSRSLALSGGLQFLLRLCLPQIMTGWLS